jgi:hypothetical protein
MAASVRLLMRWLRGRRAPVLDVAVVTSTRVSTAGRGVDVSA